MATSTVEKCSKKRSNSSDEEADGCHGNEEKNGAKGHSNETRSTEEKGKQFDIQSANSWESVDLGDEQRKAKFLKLMGAAKKEHHGRFVIGEPVQTRHGRSEDDVKSLENHLEEQYDHCLAERAQHTRKKHKGLGFADDLDDPSYSGGGCPPDDPEDRVNDDESAATAKTEISTDEEDPLPPTIPNDINNF